MESGRRNVVSIHFWRMKSADMVLSTFMAAKLQKVFKSDNFYISYLRITFVFYK